MDFKKMTIRKSASSLFGIVIGILITIAFFIAMFNYVNYNATNSGVILSDTYGNATYELTNAQTRLKTNADSIKEGLNQVREPEEGIFSVLNGLKGLASVFLLPINIIDITTQTYQAINGVISQNTGVPSWMIDLTSVGLFIFALFIIWSVMKGDQQKIV